MLYFYLIEYKSNHELMKYLIFLSFIPGLLIISFSILKFLNIIGWSWYIIFIPLEIYVLLSIILTFIIILYVKIFKGSLDIILESKFFN